MGYGNRGMVEIISGLDDDDQVVTVGQASLKQDSKVTVINRADDDELAAETSDQDDSQQESDDAPTD